jgi:mannose-6-phosphate isomerase-like protein (cupin superfamily)
MNLVRALAQFLVALLVASPLMSCAQAELDAERADAAVLLQAFADAWRGKEALELENELVLAFWISGAGGGEYHVVLGNSAGARVRPEVPEYWDIGFELEQDVLYRLAAGELNALTAMGQAVASDPTPLVPRFGAAFASSPDAGLIFRRVAFHFWSRDWPVTIPFREEAARFVHGGNAVVLVYDNRIRSAWYQIAEDMHINADPRQQVNDYPQLLIVIKGEFNARFDGVERRLSEGISILVPAGMQHEFWAGTGESGEFIWIAFGEGA